MFVEIALPIIGALLGFLIRSWMVRRQRSSGTIYVTHKEEKILYSLELDDYPESIQFKKTVVFKVDSDESLNRE